MKKNACLLIIFGLIAFMSLPAPAQASPDGTILCLSGLLPNGGGSGGPACIAETADFFGIITPLPWVTQLYRMQFLLQSTASGIVGPYINAIIGYFGISGMPGF